MKRDLVRLLANIVVWGTVKVMEEEEERERDGRTAWLVRVKWGIIAKGGHMFGGEVSKRGLTWDGKLDCVRERYGVHRQNRNSLSP